MKESNGRKEDKKNGAIHNRELNGTGPGRSNHCTAFHEPALVEEVLEWCDIREGRIVADLTTGTGGHAIAIAGRIGENGFLLGIDRDEQALAVARTRMGELGLENYTLVKARFSQLKEVAEGLGIDKFDAVVADLGIGTHQLDKPERGFSFMSDGPLDMRYDPQEGRGTAADIIATASEQELADIFRNYGEERYSQAIARAVCAARQRSPIKTTGALADIAKRVVGSRTKGRRLRIHPATRVMMSLRMVVNDEVGELERLLKAAPAVLKKNGRIALLCYHSIESRAVKRRWREMKKAGVMAELKGSPVKPTPEQARANRRVRAVQMRVAEKL